MRKIPVLFACMLALLSKAQITVINTGTSESLVSITRFQNNYLISGYQNYLSKCYNNCNTLLPLTVPVFPNSSYGFTVDRIDTSVLYMTASSFQGLNLTYWKSVDGGYNWIKKFDTTGTNLYSGITRFFDAQNGISINVNEGTIYTTDGFNTYHFGTWESTYPKAIEVYGDSTVIVGGCAVPCGWSISKDRGNTWLPETGFGTGVCRPIDFEFLNKDTIFAITDVANQVSCFVKTFNAGSSWNNTIFTGQNGIYPPPETFTKVYAKKSNEVYLLARNGLTSNGYEGYAVILKTNDLGQTWSRFITPFKDFLYDMEFINDSTALISGSSGLLFKWNTKTAVFTGFKNNEPTDLAVNVFPNPVNDKLLIEFNGNTGTFKAKLSTIFGQMINEFSFEDKNGEIDLTKYPAGIYFLRVENEKGYKVTKIIKD